MRITKALVSLLVCALLLCACDYIVLPEEEDGPLLESKGWSAVATGITASDAGGVRIELTLRNDTADWSAMKADENQPAMLKFANGKKSSCDTVFVSSGGHRLAPGFQMRGYVSGMAAQPATQPIYVECKGTNLSPGSVLLIGYSYVTGDYNYYYPDNNKATGTLEVNLDRLATGLEYPLAAQVKGLIQPPDVSITALNDCVLTLTGVQRSEDGFQFDWLNTNPGEYPSYVHVGNPPVIGSDGILYGIYQSPDLASAPSAGGGKTAEWNTTVSAPAGVSGFYILLSVESKRQRYFVHYAIDISDR